MPFPMPIKPARSTLIPRWLRELCVSRFENANKKYGDLWATMPNLDGETNDEIADVDNYSDFARERGAWWLAVWAIQFMCGLQARLVKRFFKDLRPILHVESWQDVATDIDKLEN